MSEEELLAMATARVLLIETPADQIPITPAPPAQEIEAAALWQPVDHADGQTERIPLANPEEKEAAAAYAIWLGGALVHMNLAESRADRNSDPQPRDRDEDDDEDGEPKR
jgi:hypothetical protein